MQLHSVILSIVLLHTFHIFSAEADSQPTYDQLAQALAKGETTPEDVIRNFEASIVKQLLQKAQKTVEAKNLFKDRELFEQCQLITRACWSPDGKYLATALRKEKLRKFEERIAV